jgi:phage tail-like protein
MPETETISYLLLDGHQGLDPQDGWRAQQVQGLQITAEKMSLAPIPAPPVPLKDAQGTFGGLENPTGVAVDSDGTIYVSDSGTHRIYKIVRRAGMRPRGHFFRFENGPFAHDRFVYIPAANRLERWPHTIPRSPQSLTEVEILCETVWNESQARNLVLSKHTTGTLEEWEEEYPAPLPAGTVCETSIDSLPCLGGKGAAPRLFNEPRGLAISRAGNLYVADSRNHRIQVFSLRGLVLKAIWGKCASWRETVEPPPSAGCLPPEEHTVRRGEPIAGKDPGEFQEPWDVAADRAGDVYIADKGNGRLQMYDCRTRTFLVINGATLSAHFFQVLYGPEAGERFVFVSSRSRLERWPRALGRNPANAGEADKLSNETASLNDARKRLLEAIDAKGAKDILVEWDGAYPENLETDQPFEKPTHLALDAAGRVYVVDQEKEYVKVLDPKGRVLGKVIYVSDVPGRFRPTAVAVDAEGELVLAGTGGVQRFQVDYKGQGFAAAASVSGRQGDYAAMAVDDKGSLFVVGGGAGGVAEMPSQGGFEKAGTYFSRALDSRVYRCQWHKTILDFVTDIPIGTSVTVWTYTSESERTPEEILALEEEDWQTGQTNAKDFLILSPPGRFLWLKMEFKGNGIDTPALRYLKTYFPRFTYMQYLPAVYQADPASKDFLERFLSIFETFLSSIEDKIENIWRLFNSDIVPDSPDFLTWLAGWIDMVFYPSWSTETRRRLLRHAPELYRKRGIPGGLKRLLQLALGVDVQILEHFQLRRWLFLASQSTLGNRSQLWGNCIISRLQLDENSAIGDFALVGTGDPVRDPFHVYAHKFSVFVPAFYCRSDLTERTMRHLIESEKPAHAQYSLCKVEGRFRVGMQATIGFDTLVGAYPRLMLNYCATLGYDTLLGRAPEEKGPPIVKVDERCRVGVNAVVG